MKRMNDVSKYLSPWYSNIRKVVLSDGSIFEEGEAGVTNFHTDSSIIIARREGRNSVYIPWHAIVAMYVKDVKGFTGEDGN